jgi:hypothetical protein
LAWRYTFDGGPEQELDASSIYQVAAMAAFSREAITRLPNVPPGPGIKSYDGHVITLWDDLLVDLYPPSLYGLGFDEFGCLKILMLGRSARI